VTLPFSDPPLPGYVQRWTFGWVCTSWSKGTPEGICTDWKQGAYEREVGVIQRPNDLIFTQFPGPHRVVMVDFKRCCNRLRVMSSPRCYSLQTSKMKTSSVFQLKCAVQGFDTSFVVHWRCQSKPQPGIRWHIRSWDLRGRSRWPCSPSSRASELFWNTSSVTTPFFHFSIWYRVSH
jgi:hypothetical protein